MNATVAHSRSLLDDLLAERMKPGGSEAALRAIVKDAGKDASGHDLLPYALLWALRYRPPKDIYARPLLALAAAHARMCDRQLDRYRAARAATDTSAGGMAAALTRLAAAIAGEGHGAQEE